MGKTFYTVEYAVFGADKTSIAYFDDRAKAYAFYNSGDYLDKPVAHHLKREDKIYLYEYLVSITDYNLSDKKW